jgi:hypothetical protein
MQELISLAKRCFALPEHWTVTLCIDGFVLDASAFPFVSADSVLQVQVKRGPNKKAAVVSAPTAQSSVQPKPPARVMQAAAVKKSTVVKPPAPTQVKQHKSKQTDSTLGEASVSAASSKSVRTPENKDLPSGVKKRPPLDKLYHGKASMEIYQLPGDRPERTKKVPSHFELEGYVDESLIPFTHAAPLPAPSLRSVPASASSLILLPTPAIEARRESPSELEPKEKLRKPVKIAKRKHPFSGTGGRRLKRKRQLALAKSGLPSRQDATPELSSAMTSSSSTSAPPTSSPELLDVHRIKRSESPLPFRFPTEHSLKPEKLPEHFTIRHPSALASFNISLCGIYHFRPHALHKESSLHPRCDVEDPA